MKVSRLVLVLLLIALPAMAQTEKVHTVQPGDTLWQLSGIELGDSYSWGRFVEANNFLSQPGRTFERNGKFIVLIKPGEQLMVPINMDEQVMLAPVSVTEFQQANASGGSPWNPLWLLLALVVVLTWLGYLAMDYRKNRQREREMRLNPITSGPAIVPGGIPAAEQGRLSNHFDDQAAARWRESHPNAPSEERPVRISEIQSGMIHGEGMVGYRDQARPRRIDSPGVLAYQARFRFPDGSEEIMQSLQGCMNPVYYGEGLRGFTFTPTATVVPVPQAPTPMPLQPAAHVATMRVDVGFAEFTVPEGSFVNVVNGEIRIQLNTPGTIAGRPVAKVRRAKAAKPATPAISA